MSATNNIDYLRLVDADDNIYNFPDSFWIKDEGWQVSSNVKNIAFAAGGKDTADGYLQSRTILIEGQLRASDKYTLESRFRDLQRAVLSAGRLFVIGDVVNRYIEVSAPMVNSNYSNDYRLEKLYNITYLADYPFWQDTIETEIERIIDFTTGLSETFQIDNSDSDFLVKPTIKIEADQGYDLPSIRLTNLSDAGMFFLYENSDFVQGDTLIIDCNAGTVKKNGVDTVAYFTTPRFLRLQNTNNSIIYEGNPCTITFSFRRVYL